jgi:NADPH:quinone reductase-like Zn-dependent oxidoreductase
LKRGGSTTRAIVWTKYGAPDGLAAAEVAPPTAGPGDLLIRVRATAVTAGDCELRALRLSWGFRVLVRLLMGPLRPRRKVLGQEFAGDIEAVGDGVTRFRVGDPVFGTTGFRFGAYAEYLVIPERAADGVVAIKPDNLTYCQAATVPTGGLEALRLLRRAGGLAGASVLVIGAGGGIGINAVQLAVARGAHVTGVETTTRLELVRSLGAEHVIDFTREDATSGGPRFDVIFDAVGAGSLRSLLPALRPGGTYVSANPRGWTRIEGALRRRGSGQRVVVSAAPPTREDLDALRTLIEAGSLRAVVDRQYPLDDLPEAHRYIDAGRAQGRVAILVAPLKDPPARVER